MKTQKQINKRVKEIEQKAKKRYIDSAEWEDVLDTLSDREINEYRKLVGESIKMTKKHTFVKDKDSGVTVCEECGRVWGEEEKYGCEKDEN